MTSRRAFLGQLALPAFIAAPVHGGARIDEGQDSPASAPSAKPIFVPPDGSRSIEPTGAIKVRVSGRDTGGAMTVFEVPTQRDAGAPLHVHHVENEWFYALRGEYDIKVGDEIFRLKRGGSVYAPRLIPHTWHDVGESAGTLLVIAQPAGHIEAFMVDLARLNAGPEPPTPEAMRAMFAEHDMEIVGPPLPKKGGPR